MVLLQCIRTLGRSFDCAFIFPPYVADRGGPSSPSLGETALSVVLGDFYFHQEGQVVERKSSVWSGYGSSSPWFRCRVLGALHKLHVAQGLRFPFLHHETIPNFTSSFFSFRYLPSIRPDPPRSPKRVGGGGWMRYVGVNADVGEGGTV